MRSVEVLFIGKHGFSEGLPTTFNLQHLNGFTLRNRGAPGIICTIFI